MNISQFTKPLEPPDLLAEAGQELWRKVTRAGTLEGAYDRMILTDICQIEDEVAKYRAIVAVEGEQVANRFGDKKAHPLLLQIHRLIDRQIRLRRELYKDRGPRRPLGRPINSRNRE